MNIVNGIVAKDNVNLHEYKSVRMGIIPRMVGQHVFSVSFERNDEAKTLGRSSVAKVAPD